jgi:two-component system chemotaxis sensor kinase CheA
LIVSLSNLGRETRGREAAGETRLDDAFGLAEGLAAQLYRAVLETRMVPVADVVERYRRAVGEIARHSRKRIRFEVFGADTEIDKSVSERLAEPLLHLVRNSADHGVETPEERRAAGKPEEGLIRFTARRESRYLEIRVEDDGRGIPLDKVRVKAAEAGLVPSEGPVERDRLLDCLFEPGFTLADKVTRWSGRGVGLDAVRGALKSLRGEVRLETEEGRGSAAVLRIPVTLSLVEGFVARAGEYLLLIPFDTVESCGRFSDPGGGSPFRQVETGGRLRACVDLAALYSGASSPGERVVVTVRSVHGTAGILVDEVGETLTATVRPVDRKPGEAPGIAGSAILGDGRLLLVLDTEEICRSGIGDRLGS